MSFFLGSSTISSTKIYGATIIYSFFCAQPFAQELGSSLIYIFYLYTAIRQKYMLLFYLFFLLCTTIRPKIWVFVDLFLSCAHNHSAEICDFLIFIISFVRDHWMKTEGTHLFIFLYAHNHVIKICGPLPFIIPFVHDHSTKKIWVFINIFISFVYDHSTKIRGHCYSLIYSLINYVYISYATFIAVLIYFVHYIYGRTTLRFRTLCPWLYEVQAQKTEIFLVTRPPTC